MNTMRKFETPEIEMIRFSATDILTTSDFNEFPITPIQTVKEDELVMIGMD